MRLEITFGKTNNESDDGYTNEEGHKVFYILGTGNHIMKLKIVEYPWGESWKKTDKWFEYKFLEERRQNQESSHRKCII